MMKKYLSILFILFIVQCGFAQIKNETDDYRDYFEISEMSYDYTIEYNDDDQKPFTLGTLSVKLVPKRKIDKYILMLSKPYYEKPGFFINNIGHTPSDGETSSTYKIDNVRWGTEYKVKAIYTEENELWYIYSDLFDVTDLLSEEDRTQVLDYVSSAEVAKCGDAMEVVGGKAEFVGDNCGEYLIYDLNGSCVARGKFAPNDVVLLPENCPCMCIMQVIYENNEVVTKKIFR